MKTIRFGLFMILLATLCSVVALPYVPEKLAIHWGAQGDADGYLSAPWGAFLLPALMLLLLFAKGWLPNTSKKENKDAQKARSLSFDVLFLFFFILHALVLLYNTGFAVNIVFLVLFATSVLFVALGAYMPKLSPNDVIGIRTIWTLTSDVVWEKTHVFGGKVFIVAGLSMLILLFLPLHHLYTMIPALLATVIVVFASYRYHQEEKKQRS